MSKDSTVNETSEAIPLLTSRQRTILDFIRDRVNEKGFPPSVREIGEAVGLTSTSSVATGTTCNGHAASRTCAETGQRYRASCQECALPDQGAAVHFHGPGWQVSRHGNCGPKPYRHV